MYYIDNRLKHITGKKTEPFGGLNVIAVGYFAQLPPVGDVPLWKDLGAMASERKQYGRFLYESFNKVIILNEMIRQTHATFSELLERVRNGTWRKSDWKLLQTRWPSKLTQKERKTLDSQLTRSFGRNRMCNDFNSCNSQYTFICVVSLRH